MTYQEQVFQLVFDEVLDYLPDFKRKAAEWGKKIYDLIEQDGKVVISDRDEYPVEFTYALTFAVIVGEFGQFGYGDHFLIEMALPDREITVEGDIIPLPAFHVAIWERKEDINRALNDVYTSRQLDHASEVYTSLEKLFEPVVPSDTGCMKAYLYVSNGFSY
jgi:hypothetical protein